MTDMDGAIKDKVAVANVYSTSNTRFVFLHNLEQLIINVYVSINSINEVQMVPFFIWYFISKPIYNIR